MLDWIFLFTLSLGRVEVLWFVVFFSKNSVSTNMLCFQIIFLTMHVFVVIYFPRRFLLQYFLPLL